MIGGSVMRASIGGAVAVLLACSPSSKTDLGNTGCPGKLIACGLTDTGQPLCVNALADDDNCGGCGVTCPGAGTLTSCENGSCACLLQTCPMPDGGQGCFDTTSSVENCGGCSLRTPRRGVSCSAGESCINSECRCDSPYVSCPSADGTDAGYCADTTSDALNCGGCGNICSHDQKCAPDPMGMEGTCVCDLGEAGGADLIVCPSGCVHSMSDARNCGSCGFQCATGICNMGLCQCDPDAGILQCTPTACATVSSDVSTCGSCGNDCTQGGTLMIPGIVCGGGQCLCEGGQGTICLSVDEDSATSLACVDTTSDPNNCGGCGIVPDGGGPYPDGGLPPSAFICADVCSGGGCVCGGIQLSCAAGTWNADGGPNDAGACLSVATDANNCGACGNACSSSYAANAVCQQSSCACMDAGLCVTSDDPMNPVCSCDGPYSAVPPNPACTELPTLTYTRDILPLFRSTYVGDAGWGMLIGCATSGCHSPGANGPTAGIDFTDAGASYQILAGGSQPIENGCGATPILNPSSICLCQSLTIPGQGSYSVTGGSLLFGLLSNQIFNCQDAVGGIANPMPIDDAGHPYPISPCLQAQVRQWIDQGAAY